MTSAAARARCFQTGCRDPLLSDTGNGCSPDRWRFNGSVSCMCCCNRPITVMMLWVSRNRRAEA
jgi:hypothetical protein